MYVALDFTVIYVKLSVIVQYRNLAIWKNECADDVIADCKE